MCSTGIRKHVKMRVEFHGFIHFKNLIGILFYMTNLLIRAVISKLYLSLARLSGFCNFLHLESSFSFCCLSSTAGSCQIMLAGSQIIVHTVTHGPAVFTEKAGGFFNVLLGHNYEMAATVLQ